MRVAFSPGNADRKEMSAPRVSESLVRSRRSTCRIIERVSERVTECVRGSVCVCVYEREREGERERYRERVQRPRE